MAGQGPQGSASQCFVQGLAYATLAKLPTEYGLYTSYLSAIIYTFLGSSKDLAVGPQELNSIE